MCISLDTYEAFYCHDQTSTKNDAFFSERYPLVYVDLVLGNFLDQPPIFDRCVVRRR